MIEVSASCFVSLGFEYVFIRPIVIAFSLIPCSLRKKKKEWNYDEKPLERIET